MRTIPVLATALLSLSAFAQAPRAAEPAAKKAPAAEAPAFEFEQFQLVLLRRAPDAPKVSDEEAKEIQKKHIGHLEAMHSAGHLLIAGPLSDQPDPSLRGVCIYRAPSVAEAKRLAELDPAVKAGRLVVEAMTWHVGKGYMTFPKAVQPAKAP